MIKYFVLDIDGCLAYPFQTPDWQAVTAIRELQAQSDCNEHIPALSLCTGRPQPYTEAVAQWLGIRDTVIFESGGGFYHPVTNKLTWSPHFTAQIRQKSQEIRAWFVTNIRPQFPDMMFEFSKYTDVGVNHTDANEIRKLYKKVSRKVEEEYPEFEVHYTSASLNIIVKACNKVSGLQFFADLQKVLPKEVAYMGDSLGDLGALKWSGAPFAPSNAIKEVREQAHVMSCEATSGVLEAYRATIAWNENSNVKKPVQKGSYTVSND